LPHNDNGVNIGQDIEMGSTMRRGSYHHGDLANALTSAATDLARQGGPEAVVLREAARQVGVSPTAAYRHFASHGDLIHEVKERCQVTLAEYMDAELATGTPADDPEVEAVRHLRALGMGYIRFALAEPGLFRTAFWHTGMPKEMDLSGQFDAPAYAKLSAALDRLTELGLIQPEDRPLAEVFPWAVAHGLSALLVDGPLGGLPEEFRDAAVHRAMTAVIDGLCRRPWSSEHPEA
jgi:AcrR family transcriptional regulator